MIRSEFEKKRLTDVTVHTMCIRHPICDRYGITKKPWEIRSSRCARMMLETDRLKTGEPLRSSVFG